MAIRVLIITIHLLILLAIGSATDAGEVSNDDGAVCDASVVDKIFDGLSDDEKEKAARASSYRYLVASASGAAAGEGADRRDGHARAAIERYVTVEQKLHGSKSPEAWEAAASAKLRRTLEYREEMEVDAIRRCFDEDKLEDGLHATICKRLEEYYAPRRDIIRGYTKEGRAMYQNFPRHHTEWEEEYYIKGNIYMLERALACTERKTDGGEDKVVIFYDYNGYGMKNSPPPMLVKHLLSDLRDHWPERLVGFFIVDAPLVFFAFWAIVKHFIDPITKQLVQFVTGEGQKKILRELVSEDQAAPYMFEGGKNGNEADMKAFFYDTPFDHVYGEELSKAEMADPDQS